MWKMNMNKILAIDLPMDSVCPYIGFYESSFNEHMNSFPSYDFVSLDNIQQPHHAAAVILDSVMKEYLNNPKLTLETLQNTATSTFFKKFDQDNETHKDISVRLYSRIVDAYNMVSALIGRYQHIATVLDFYTALGIRPRNAYHTYIDAMLVDKKSTDLFLMLRRESGSDVHVGYNIKLLAALDYCAEASIKVDNIYYIGYDWNLFTTNAKLTMSRITVTDHIRNVASRFSSIALPNFANLAYCGQCSHKNSCVKNNFYGKAYA